ncbi:hypothetical protein [Denitromonas iodatirespirans]|uniref:Uncharacterized protein n=1 Tax=Denitromonas iodatirespirans TaxID=2795389 RepID=A0A944D472_DENI1|nr:hypothetical protein [Denitromonas iodatirespirans]MBT0959540.1 hypothetical protein [Denitromonas iodatirespirans]
MSDQNPKPETPAKPAKTPRTSVVKTDVGAGKPAPTEERPSPDQQLDSLMSHYEGCRLEIIELMQSNERLLNIAILILGAVMTYGISVDAHKIVALGPFALSIVVFQGIQRYELVYQLGGYRKYLEEKMQDLTGDKPAFWEDLVAQLFHRSWTHYPLRALIVLAFLLLCAVGVDAVTRLAAPLETIYRYLAVGSYTGLLVGVSIAVGINFRHYKASFAKAYDLACILGKGNG